MNDNFSAPVLLELDPWLQFFMEWLKQNEGFRSSPYLDSGDLPTIGYGMTYYPDGNRVSMLDKSLDANQAILMTKIILIPFINTVNTFVLAPIEPMQRVALIDFCYNCGEQSLALSTLLQKINDNPADLQIADEFMKWVYCKGKMLKGLVRRRKEEVDLYFSVFQEGENEHNSSPKEL